MSVPAVERPPFDPSGHRLAVVATPGAAAIELSAWVRAGAERSEAVVAVLADGGAVEGVRVLPPQEVFAEAALEALLAAALRDGCTGLRVVVDVEAGLRVLDPPAYEAFEGAVDRLCRQHPLSVLCRYAADRTVGPVMRGAVAAHSGGVHDGRASAAFAPSGSLLVDGEVDAGNCEVLGAAVAAAAARATGAAEDEAPTLEVDLSATTFLSSAGVRALLVGSQVLRESGGRLVLGGAAPPVERVLRAWVVDELPGVAMTAGAR